MNDLDGIFIATNDYLELMDETNEHYSGDSNCMGNCDDYIEHEVSENGYLIVEACSECKTRFDDPRKAE